MTGSAKIAKIAKTAQNWNAGLEARHWDVKRRFNSARGLRAGAAVFQFWQFWR
jgi:hypothetical protein